MNREQKNKIVSTLTNHLAESKNIYFTDIAGLNSEQTYNLRGMCFEKGVNVSVVKNTLLKIASEKNKIELSGDLFSGSTAIALSYEEPVAAAKVIKGFLKDHELPIVKGLVFEGAYHDAGQFYWGTKEAFNSNSSILSDIVIPFILPRHLVQDIDTLEDWRRAEIMHEVIQKINREI